MHSIMKNKQNRLNAIRFIIANEQIGSQEELLKRLLLTIYQQEQVMI
jgi:arginine repressor